MSIIEIAQKTRLCARKLAVLSAEAKNQAIEAMAKALEAAAPDIVGRRMRLTARRPRLMELPNRCTIASSWTRAS
jgi:gamma-glutamyl phosphate reductase